MAEKVEIICDCFKITRQEIEETLKLGKEKTLEYIQHETRAGTACGKCVEKIKNIILE